MVKRVFRTPHGKMRYEPAYVLGCTMGDLFAVGCYL